MKNYIYLFVILFLLISCGKKQEIRITALNPANGEPWPGLHYSITQEKTGAFSENYKVIHEGFLDANGKAVTQVKMKNASYRIDIEDPGNTCYQNNVQYTFAKNDSNFDFTFELVPCAYVKLKINNVNCQGLNDSMILYRNHIIPDYYTGIGWLQQGCVNWETNGYSDLPMGVIYYRWDVTRSGITNTFYDTVSLSAGEYKIYTINY